MQSYMVIEEENINVLAANFMVAHSAAALVIGTTG